MITVRKFNKLSTALRTFRITFIDKLNVQNTFLVPKIKGAEVFIELKSLENFDNSRLIAAAFILRLISGQKPYVSRLGLFQTFREKDYDAQVRVDLSLHTLYDFLDLLAHDVLPFLSKADFFSNAILSKEGVVVNFTISDLSFLRVVETHSIFFK